MLEKLVSANSPSLWPRPVKQVVHRLAALRVTPNAVTTVGLGLMLGFLTRTAAVFGILMLALYYLATPPWPGFVYAIPSEGAYMIINKTFIELCALFVTLLFPTGHIIGLDRLVRLARSGGEVRESYA